MRKDRRFAKLAVGVMLLEILTSRATVLAEDAGAARQINGGRPIVPTRSNSISYLGSATPGYRLTRPDGLWIESRLISHGTDRRESVPAGTKYSASKFDVHISETDQGLKEEVTVVAPSSPHEFAFSVTWSSGLTETMPQPGGLLLGMRGIGGVFFLPPFVAWDRSGRRVSVDSRRTGDVHRVTLLPDSLAQYPIVLDPTVVESGLGIGMPTHGSQRTTAFTLGTTNFIAFQDSGSLRLSYASDPEYSNWSTTDVAEDSLTFSLATDRQNQLWVASESTSHVVTVFRFQKSLGVWHQAGSPLEITLNGRFPSIAAGTDDSIWVSYEERANLPPAVRLYVQGIPPTGPLPERALTADLTSVGGLGGAYSSLVPTASGLGILYNDTANQLAWRWGAFPFTGFGAAVSTGRVADGRFSGVARDWDEVDILAARTLTADCGLYYSRVERHTLVATPVQVGEASVDCSDPDEYGSVSLTSDIDSRSYGLYIHRVGEGQNQIRFLTIQGGSVQPSQPWLSDERLLDAVLVGNLGLTDRTVAAGDRAPADVPFAQQVGHSIFLGLRDPFGHARFQLGSSASSAIGPIFEYSTSTGWKTLEGLTDGTGGFSNSGDLRWSPPPDWVPSTVQATTAYWIKITRSNPLVTLPPVASQITPVEDNMAVSVPLRGYRGVAPAWTRNIAGSTMIQQLFRDRPDKDEPCRSAVKIIDEKKGRVLTGQYVTNDDTFDSWFIDWPDVFNWNPYGNATGYELEYYDSESPVNSQECPPGRSPDFHSFQVHSVSGTSRNENWSSTDWQSATGIFSNRVFAKSGSAYYGNASKLDRFVALGVIGRWSGARVLACTEDASFSALGFSSVLSNVLNAWDGLGGDLRVRRKGSGDVDNCRIRSEDLGSVDPARTSSQTDSSHFFGGMTVIQLNSRFMFSESPTQTADTYDITTVLLHEVGHATGVSHNVLTRSVMFGQISPGERRRSWSLYELGSQQFMYGARPEGE